MAKTANALPIKDLADMIHVDEDKRTLTSEELLKLVNEKFNLVMTKSAMLKLIRLEGYSVAQNRCYNAYLQIEKKVNAKKEKVAEEITK